jgi:ABC-type transport system involved in multi-copper enzyme maturation permease subunit
LLIGPVFSREVFIAPRRARFYVARAAYVAALLLLTATAWLVLTGTQVIRDVGDLARFGSILFQILAPLQLALAMFFSAMLAASAVAQEKDRRTLLLLLLTRLSNSELVLGKLLASLLSVLVLLAASLPLFMLMALLGGVSFAQIGRVMAVTTAGILLCGSIGSTLALWREKTFQALALTVLVVVLWLAGGEIVAAGALGRGWAGLSAGDWAVVLSPWQAILAATRPSLTIVPALGPLQLPVYAFLLVAALVAVLVNLVGVAMVRVWNPSREAIPQMQPDAEDEGAARAAAISSEAARTLRRSRPVWDNPILWREIRTWAYGRKIVVIRLVYIALCMLAAVMLHGQLTGGASLTRAAVAAPLVPLFLLSLLLVNAQAVTSLTSERDVRALDLLLVSDITAKEFIFGKLGGIFYNSKEMVLLPLALCGYLWFGGALDLEDLLYLLGGLAVLYVFVAVVGLHTGMSYDNSRTAIATSLGTVFFLFVGVATCMRIMIAFSGAGGSFHAELQPFLAFMIGGGVGLYVALGSRNPSTAIGVASLVCPFATFYAITSLLLDYTLGVFLVVTAAYGFATAAMLVPAIYEFDVATGRTTADE